MVKEGRLNDEDSIKLLMENSVALQKVLADLAMSLSSLTTEMSQMMILFKDFSRGMGEEKAVRAVDGDHKTELIKKLDTLIDQNKSISKGLILLESTLRTRSRELY